jgi:hypothetical protein
VIARGFARRRLITSAAAAIDVLQFGAGEFSHDQSPPMGQPYDKYVLAVSLSVFALQGFAPRANSVFRIRENLRAKGGSSPLELERHIHADAIKRIERELLAPRKPECGHAQ